jgi:CAAX prenyl protease-like protein
LLMSNDPITLNYQPKPARKPLVRDDLAYILPMAVFLAWIWVGTKGPETEYGNAWYPWTYVARALTVGVMLVLFRHSYTKIRWNHWWLGVIVGVVGIFQWVGVQIFLQNHVAFFKPSGKVFNPEMFFANETTRWAFVAVRLFGAVIVVPFMEELFWRDYGWRSIVAPNDFKLAHVGEWDWKAFVVIPLVFALVHGNWWLTAIVWAVMVGGLLVYTKSLGACIIAHATTNLLLGLYVLYTKQWFFW